MSKPTLADQLGNSLPIISSTARAAFVASHFILALGSGLAIMYLVIGTIGDALTPWLSYVVAWAGSLVWYRAIENPLRKFILFAWAYRLTSKEERAGLTDNLRRTGKASVTVTAILVAVTLSLSLLINVDVAEAVTTEQDSTDEMAQSKSVTTSYDRDVDLLRDQLEAARARDAQSVLDATRQRASWIGQAEASKGQAMRELLHKGNGWAASQLRPAIRRATSKGDKHIEATKTSAEAPTLQAQLTGYVGTRSAARDTVATMTTGLVAARRVDFLNTKGRRNWMLFIAVCFVLSVFIYTSRLLVLACLETGEKLDDEEPGEGVAKVAARKVKQVNTWLGAKLDRMGADKFVLAPSTTAPASFAQPVVPPVAATPKPVAPPVAPVATTATTTPVSVAKTPTTVVGQDFEAVASSCSPEDLRSYKDQFRHNQKRQHTSATTKGRADCRDKYLESVGVLSALGYVIKDTGGHYRQTHKIDGKPTIVTYAIKAFS
jgi:hypothetical protein